MKTKGELQRDIVVITMKINKEFPELSKYLIETPVKFSESNITSNGISKHDLEEYYNSLDELLKSYSEEHLIMNQEKRNLIENN